MKKVIFLISTVVLLGACSGGGSKQPAKLSAELKPYQIEIKGYLGDYLQVFDGMYKVESVKDGMLSTWVVKIKVNSIQTYLEDDYGLQDGNGGPLMIDLCDEQGMPLNGFEALRSEYTEDVKIEEVLKYLGSEDWIMFRKYQDLYSKTLPDNISTFSVYSEKIEKRETSSSTTSTKAKTTSSTTGSGDWDAILDDYEDYMDKYIKLIKKANEGDVSAVSEYISIYQKAATLSEKLSNANDDLTTAQYTRFMEIQSKMLQAASEISN
ncbi:MAG: hypothetical protein JEY96_14920 [Bacteroidales bacterium]|nr:hypothetical protein [Bacteroidales bacterium]